MPNMRHLITQDYVTPIVLADTTDFNPTAANVLGSRTHQIDLTGVASGSYRQGEKIDFGEYHPLDWECTLVVEPASAPTFGGLVHVYLGFSPSATAGVGNPGNLSGADAAYVGYGALAADATEAVGQLVTLGARGLTADAAVQIVHFNRFTPRARYACPLVRNATSVALASDAVEMSLVFRPMPVGSR